MGKDSAGRENQSEGTRFLRVPLLQALSGTSCVADGCHGSLESLSRRAHRPRPSFRHRPAKGDTFRRAKVPSTVRHRLREWDVPTPVPDLASRHAAPQGIAIGIASAFVLARMRLALTG